MTFSHVVLFKCFTEDLLSLWFENEGPPAAGCPDPAVV